MWACSSDLALRPCTQLLDIDQMGGNSAPADVCMTSLLQFQHLLSPITKWQPTAKDAFLIILHSLNTAVTTVGVRMHAKLFCHVKIKLKSFLKRAEIFEAYSQGILEISPFVIDNGVLLQHKLNLGSD